MLTLQLRQHTIIHNDYSRHKAIHIFFFLHGFIAMRTKNNAIIKRWKNISIKCNGFSSFGFYYFLLSYCLNLYLLLLVFSTMYVPSIWEKNTEGGRDNYIFALKLEFSAPKISMSDNLFFFLICMRENSCKSYILGEMRGLSCIYSANKCILKVPINMEKFMKVSWGKSFLGAKVMLKVKK